MYKHGKPSAGHQLHGHDASLCSRRVCSATACKKHFRGLNVLHIAMKATIGVSREASNSHKVLPDV